MVCQRCGCRQSIVVMVRDDTNGLKLRRRKCKHCGNRYWTVQPKEKTISKYEIEWSGSSKTHNEELTYRGTL